MVEWGQEYRSASLWHVLPDHIASHKYVYQASSKNLIQTEEKLPVTIFTISFVQAVLDGRDAKSQDADLVQMYDLNGERLWLLSSGVSGLWGCISWTEMEAERSVHLNYCHLLLIYWWLLKMSHLNCQWICRLLARVMKASVNHNWLGLICLSILC